MVATRVRIGSEVASTLGVGGCETVTVASLSSLSLTILFASFAKVTLDSTSLDTGDDVLVLLVGSSGCPKHRDALWPS